jgi:hypothetical protein
MIVLIVGVSIFVIRLLIVFSWQEIILLAETIAFLLLNSKGPLYHETLKTEIWCC